MVIKKNNLNLLKSIKILGIPLASFAIIYSCKNKNSGDNSEIQKANTDKIINKFKEKKIVGIDSEEKLKEFLKNNLENYNEDNDYENIVEILNNNLDKIENENSIFEILKQNKFKKKTETNKSKKGKLLDLIGKNEEELKILIENISGKENFNEKYTISNIEKLYDELIKDEENAKNNLEAKIKEIFGEKLVKSFEEKEQELLNAIKKQLNLDKFEKEDLENFIKEANDDEDFSDDKKNDNYINVVNSLKINKKDTKKTIINRIQKSLKITNKEKTIFEILTKLGIPCTNDDELKAYIKRINGDYECTENEYQSIISFFKDKIENKEDFIKEDFDKKVKEVLGIIEDFNELNDKIKNLKAQNDIFVLIQNIEDLVKKGKTALTDDKCPEIVITINEKINDENSYTSAYLDKKDLIIEANRRDAAKILFGEHLCKALSKDEENFSKVLINLYVLNDNVKNFINGNDLKIGESSANYADLSKDINAKKNIILNGNLIENNLTKSIKELKKAYEDWATTEDKKDFNSCETLKDILDLYVKIYNVGKVFKYVLDNCGSLTNLANNLKSVCNFKNNFIAAGSFWNETTKKGFNFPEDFAKKILGTVKNVKFQGANETNNGSAIIEKIKLDGLFANASDNAPSNGKCSLALNLNGDIFLVQRVLVPMSEKLVDLAKKNPFIIYIPCIAKDSTVLEKTFVLASDENPIFADLLLLANIDKNKVKINAIANENGTPELLGGTEGVNLDNPLN